MPIIRDRTKLFDASDEDLLDTYIAMTGELDAPPFEDRAVAYTKTHMAVLSAEHETGHLGIPKGSVVVAMTHEERAARIRARTAHFGASWRDAPRGAHHQSHRQEPIMATKKEAAPRGPQPKDYNVKATGKGTSKVRAESNRGKILAFIAEHKKISVSQLDDHFKTRTLGEVRILEKLGHVEQVA